MKHGQLIGALRKGKVCLGVKDAIRNKIVFPILLLLYASVMDIDKFVWWKFATYGLHPHSADLPLIKILVNIAACNLFVSILRKGMKLKSIKWFQMEK